MAVLVKETMDFGDGPQELDVYFPKRPLSPRETEQADRLDAFLQTRIPEIEEEMRREGSLHASEMEKWYALGQRLAFVEDPSLVDPNDISEGHIWKAIRQYCPHALLPTRSQRDSEGSAARREGTPLDHYNHCYLLGKQRATVTKVLPRWTDWFALVESPGVLRDSRLLPMVLNSIEAVGRPLSRHEFREFMKQLRNVFSTKPVYKDTRVLDADELANAVRSAVNQALRRQ